MAKMTAPIQQVSRLLDLVPFLSTHSYISVKELADEFGVTEKEISKELVALSFCGLPGHLPDDLLDVSFESGFVTINNHEILDIPRALTNLEVASLLIGLEIMKDSLTPSDQELREKINQLISQLSALVGSALEIEENPISAHVAQVQRAIASRSSLLIDYESALSGEALSRTIDPLSMYIEHGQTYVSAFCYLADGYRNFRMDRITSITDTKTPARDHNGEGAQEEKEVFTLALHGRARSIAEFLGEKIPAGSDEIHIQAFSSTWVEKTVVSFAPDLSLVSPAHMRSDIRTRGEKILALYRS
jgi:predicted DNA-binding transcriptional regulator YafY